MINRIQFVKAMRLKAANDKWIIVALASSVYAPDAWNKIKDEDIDGVTGVITYEDRLEVSIDSDADAELICAEIESVLGADAVAVGLE